MKLFTKICLGLAGFFVGVAAICVIIAFAMGFTTSDFIRMAEEGKFSIKLEDGELRIFDFKEEELIKIDSDMLVDDDVKVDTDSDGEKTYTISEEYSYLDVEFGAGELDIYYDDVESIQVKKENIAGFELKTDETSNTLSIEGGLNSDMDSDATLTIIIPRDFRFEEVELEIGASQANIEGLLADKIDIAIGAGQANISDLNIKEMKLEVGAGQADVTGLTVETLDVEAGMGQVNIEVNGSEKDYSYNVECGIGNVVIGDRSFGGIGANQNIQQDGSVGKINVECGIGEVRIKFTE